MGTPSTQFEHTHFRDHNTWGAPMQDRQDAEKKEERTEKGGKIT